MSPLPRIGKFKHKDVPSSRERFPGAGGKKRKEEVLGYKLSEVYKTFNIRIIYIEM